MKSHLQAKQQYQELCDREKSITVFSQYWWLDAVCGEDNWDVLLVYNKAGEIIASLPFYWKKKYGFKKLTLPKLTQKLGPWIKYPEGKDESERYGYEMNILNEFIDRTTNFDEYIQHWDYRYKNWLPFFWNGFQQTTYYTYRINKLSSIDSVYNNFNRSAKRYIKKALKGGIKVHKTEDIELFYRINKMSFDRQKIEVPYTLEFVKRLDERIKDMREIYIAENSQGKAIHTLYIAFDKECAYSIMAGGDLEYRNTGANQLLYWHALKEMSQKVNSFDFMGSMIQSIEKFNHAFGATRTSYFRVSKVNSRILKLAYCFKDLML